MERKCYLYDHIHEFCPENDKNITCPELLEARLRGRSSTPVIADPPSNGAVFISEVNVSHPQKRRKSVCRTCNKEGHNSRTCPDKK